MTKTAHFSLIIPTLNRPQVLRETLVSVFAQSLLPEKIYVVDQSDNDETKNICLRFSSVTYMHSEVKSLTKARNIGVMESINAGMDFWAFLDDDVELDPDYFKTLYEGFACNSSIVGIAAWVRPLVPVRRSFWVNTLRFIGGFDYFSKRIKMRRNFLATSPWVAGNKIIDAEWMHGGAMAVRNLNDKNIFFDENLILYALAEDRDFSYRLSKIGDTVWIPELQLLHKATPEGRVPSRKKTFMIAVHQYYLIRKHFSNSLFSTLMYWWNMSIRWIISLFVSFNGYIYGNEEMIRAGNDTREAFCYVMQKRHELKNLNMRFFHEFLLK